MALKSALVGTLLGRTALALRDYLRLLGAVHFKPEHLPLLVNDSLAARLIARLPEPGSTFLDVGAHVGSVLAAVARSAPETRLFAVEAVPQKAAALERRFPAATVFACALGEEDGQASFFVDLKRPGYSSLHRNGQQAVQEIQVPLRRLDSLLGAAETIKIDVEGAELGVLRGGADLIGTSRPLILFESVAECLYLHADLWQWLDDRDYAIVVPLRLAHNDPGLTRDGFLEAHLHPRRTSSYFAVPREKRLLVRDRARLHC